MEQGYDLNNAVATTRQQQLNTSTTILLPTLPFDLIAEILCRLPVKFLLQLRCICKSWKSLISDPKFANNHLRFSTKRYNLLVGTADNLKNLLLFDSPIPSVFSTSCITHTQRNFPIRTFKNQHGIGCSCDGILCITNSELKIVNLWNPSIKKYKRLSPPPLENQFKIVHVSLSFGYDNFIHSYKIVVVSFSEDRKTQVNVYAFDKNDWKRIQDFPFSYPICRSGIFVSGTVNWLVDKCVIVSLDLKNESYQKIPLPDINNDHCTLGLLKDCLCIFHNRDKFLDVWVMKEYEYKESWTKLYSFPYMGDQDWCAYTKVLYISEDDQMLVNFDKLRSNKLELGFYNSKNGTLKIPEIENKWMDPVVYIESMISSCF